jgi:hypothetical protein
VLNTPELPNPQTRNLETNTRIGQDFKTLKQSRAYEVDGYLISQLFDGEWQSEYML